MWSDPMRRDAMKCAMALGLPSLSEPITLVQETTTDVQAGTLLYLPIYRPKGPLFSVADPQQALVGWAYSPLRMGDQIRAALDAPLVRFPGDAEIQVFDGKATTAGLLFDSRDPEQRDRALIPGRERRLDIDGRPWILRVGLPTSSHGYGMTSIAAAVGRASSGTAIATGSCIVSSCQSPLFAMTRAISRTLSV